MLERFRQPSRKAKGAIMSRLVLCGIMSWLVLDSGAPARADDAEDRAAAFAEKLGGKVARDDKRPGKPVVTVDLHGRGVRGADLRALAPLQSLTTLDLRSVWIADAELNELAPFAGLTT